MAMGLRRQSSRTGSCEICHPNPIHTPTFGEVRPRPESRTRPSHFKAINADEMISNNLYHLSSLEVTYSRHEEPLSITDSTESQLTGWKRYFAYSQYLDAYLITRCKSILPLRPLSSYMMMIICFLVSLIALVTVTITIINHPYLPSKKLTEPLVIAVDYDEDKCKPKLLSLEYENKYHDKQEKLIEMQQFQIDTMEKKMSSLENQYVELLNSVNYNNNLLLKSTKQSDRLEKRTIKLIQDQIDVYDADHVGMPDFASQSMGGQVVSTPNTQPYLKKFSTNFFHEFIPSSLSKFNNAEEAMEPGKCWAFQGSKGNMLIQLAARIHISAVTLDHVSPKLTPYGNIHSAPNEFIVFGMAEGELSGNHIILGRFSYDQHGAQRQTFKVQNGANMAFKRVMFSVVSNHGEPRYTCIYRFRVHGRVADQPKS